MRKNDRRFMDYFMALVAIALIILMAYSIYLGGFWVGVTFLVVFWLGAFWSDTATRRRHRRRVFSFAFGNDKRLKDDSSR